MKTILATTLSMVTLLALSTSPAFAHDKHSNSTSKPHSREARSHMHKDARSYNKMDSAAGVDHNHITNAATETNLSGDTARGSGTGGNANLGYNSTMPNRQGYTYGTSNVVKH